MSREAATRLVFLAVGMAGAGWAALIPFARERAGLDDASLGLLLLGLAAGSIATMPAAGMLVPRLGCRVLIVAGLVVVAGVLAPLAWFSASWALLAALLLFGAGFGTVDVAMNMQAILVERASGRAIMSGFHGFFSLGGILGAGMMAALLASGAGPLRAALVLGVALLALLAVAASGLLAVGAAREGPAFALPRGAVLLLGVLCAIAFLVEGAVLDWGAVFLTTERGVAPVYGGLAYAAFSATMTLGRFTGDRVVARFGGARVLVWSGVLAAVGVAVAALMPGWTMVLAGFALVGAGCANMVPVLFTAVGRQTAMPESLALPAVTTLGYGGMLAGPAAIGAVAHLVGLPAALLMLAVLLLGLAACGPRLAAIAPPRRR